MPDLVDDKSDFGPPSLAERFDDFLATVDRYRDRPVIAFCGLLIVVLAVLSAWWLGHPATEADVADSIPLVSDVPPAGIATTSVTTVPTTEVEALLVHVTGAVADPGVVSIPAGSRIFEAVEAAGGVSGEADVDLLNLAAEAGDGMQVRVPVSGEEITQPLVSGSESGGDGGDGDSAEDLTVDLNQADTADLEKLPGVGPATAESILSWREENGQFQTVDDLLAVSGIGPAKLEKMRPHAAVGP